MRRRLERELRTPERGIRMATLAVLLVGLVVLLWTVSPGERRRRALTERLTVGDGTDRLVRLLGEPLRCPPGTLEHLRAALPADWPPATAEAALQRLRRDTRERWIYPLRRDEPTGCDAREGSTEVGIDANEQVLWYVAVTGKSQLRLPPGYARAGGAAASAP